MSPSDSHMQYNGGSAPRGKIYLRLERHRVRHWPAATRLHAYFRPDRNNDDSDRPALWAPWFSGAMTGPILVAGVLLAVCWWNGGDNGLWLSGWLLTACLASIVGGVSMAAADRWAARHTSEHVSSQKLKVLLSVARNDPRLQQELERFLRETEGAHLAWPEARALLSAHSALQALCREEERVYAQAHEHEALLDGAGGLRQKVLARQRADALAGQLFPADPERKHARL